MNSCLNTLQYNLNEEFECFLTANNRFISTFLPYARECVDLLRLLFEYTKYSVINKPIKNISSNLVHFTGEPFQFYIFQRFQILVRYWPNDAISSLSTKELSNI